MEILKKVLVTGVEVKDGETKSGFISAIVNFFSSDEKIPIVEVFSHVVSQFEESGLNNAIYAVIDNRIVFEDNHNNEDDLLAASEALKDTASSETHTFSLFLEEAGDNVNHIIEITVTGEDNIFNIEVVLASTVNPGIEFVRCQDAAETLSRAKSSTLLSDAKVESELMFSKIKQILEASYGENETTFETPKPKAVFASREHLKNQKPQISRTYRAKPRGSNYMYGRISSYNGYYRGRHDNSEMDFLDYYIIYLIFFSDDSSAYEVVDVYGEEIGFDDIQPIDKVIGYIEAEVEQISENLETDSYHIGQEENGYTDDDMSEDDTPEETVETVDSDDMNFDLDQPESVGITPDPTPSDCAPSDCTSDCDCAPSDCTSDCDCNCDCACDCSSD